MPEVRDVHIDTALTNLSVRYQNPELIWSKVLPIIKVNKRSDIIFKYGKGELFRVPNDSIGPQSYANTVDYSQTQDNYSVKDHALEDWVSQAEIDNADAPLSPLIDANLYVTDLLNLAQEKRVATLAFTAANYASANQLTLSGTSQWGGSTDDPIGDILNGLETTWMRPNVIVFGVDTWRVFRKLPQIVDAVKAATRLQSASGGIASETEVASLFDVESVIVGRARENTVKEGQTDSYSRIWGKHCALLYVTPSPGIRTVTFGATFAEMTLTTFIGFDERRGVKGSHFIKTAWNSAEHVIANDVGYFIQNAVA